MIFTCFECNKDYRKDFNKGLIERFVNMYEFCNQDIIYPYEYMDSWERFSETPLPNKLFKYGKLSSLNMENIT